MPLAQMTSAERIDALVNEGVIQAMADPELRAMGSIRLRAAVNWALTHMAAAEYRRRLDEEGFLASTGFAGEYHSIAAGRARAVDEAFSLAWGVGMDYDRFVRANGGSLGDGWLKKLVKAANIR